MRRPPVPFRQPLAVLLTLMAMASTGPSQAQVATYAYDPVAVWSLKIRPGFVLQILLPDGERFLQVAMGEATGWEARVEGDILFLRASAQAQATNLVWVSQAGDDRRTYRVELRATASAAALHEVRFEAPEPLAGEAGEQARIDRVRAINEALARAPFEGRRNLAYEAGGDGALAPLEVFDNGRFTVLRFAAGQPLPAFYAVAPDGSEQLVRFDVRGAYVVIHGVEPQLRLRRGAASLCLFNTAFDRAGGAFAETPVAEALERVRRVEDDHEP